MEKMNKTQCTTYSQHEKEHCEVQFSEESKDMSIGENNKLLNPSLLGAW